MPPRKVKKVMTLPINVIFRLLQDKKRVQIWLYEDTSMRLEGRIIGFDEYMNMTLDDAEEVNVKGKNAGKRQRLGRIMLKGDCVTLLQEAV